MLVIFGFNFYRVVTSATHTLLGADFFEGFHITFTMF